MKKPVKKIALVFISLILLLQVTSVAAASSIFPSDLRYPVGGSPIKMADSDINKDGFMDLVVASASSNKLSVLRGGAGGTFGIPAQYDLGVQPAGIVVSDFNGDGFPDIVVTSHASTQGLFILLNKGLGEEGTFEPAVRILGVSNGNAVTAADFNGDGRMDLALYHLDSGKHTISIMYGNGDGTFTKVGSNIITGMVETMTLGDFNGDGKLDIAFLLPNQKKFGIMLQKGSGTFNSPALYDSEGTPTDFVQGFFNNDAILDLAVSTNETNKNAVSIFIGKSDGTFEKTVSYAVNSVFAITSGDLDGDGKTDLAAVSFGNNHMTLLKGNGNGTFVPSPHYLTGMKPMGILAIDLNGDDRTDLITMNQGSNDLSVWLGNVTMDFGISTNYEAGINPNGIALGDFNGDGLIDAVVTHWYGYSIMLGKSTSSLMTRQDYGMKNSGNPSAVVAFDFDNDRISDFAVVNNTSKQVEVYMGSSNTIYHKQTIPVGTSPTDIAVGDFNKDGKPDLAVANSGSNSVSILLGNGDGSFNAAIEYSVSATPKNLALGDFDGDGNCDIAVTSSNTAEISRLLGTGTGTFGSAIVVSTGGIPSAIVANDFEGDGKANLAVSVKSTNKIYVYSFDSSATEITLEGDFSDMSTGDFNGDGKPDLAVIASTDHKVHVLLGNGDGTFMDSQSYGTGSVPVSMAAYDVNGDGKSDLAIANNRGNDISLLLSIPSAPPADSEAPEWKIGDTLTATDISQTGLTLHWPAATDNVAVHHYNVYKGADLLGTVDADNSGTYAYTVTGLTEGTINTFTIEAVDATGNISSPGLTQIFATLDPLQYGTIQLSSNRYSVNEDSGKVMITLSRTDALGGIVTVKYATSDGSAVSGTDYTAVTGTLTFEDGETVGSFDIPILNNDEDDTDKMFTITLSDPSSGAVLGAIQTAVVTIRDKNTTVQRAYEAKAVARNYTPIAGESTIITLSVYSSDGSLDANFNGDQEVTISGYVAAPTGTFGEINDEPLMLGETVQSVSFVNGEALLRLTLNSATEQQIQYRVENIIHPTCITLLEPQTASAEKLQITRQPIGSSKQGGGQLAVQPQVLVTDIFGNPVKDIRIQASRFEDGQRWVLSGSDSISGTDGLASFVNVSALNKTNADLRGVQILFTGVATSLTEEKSTGFSLLRSTPNTPDPEVPTPPETSKPTVPNQPKPSVPTAPIVPTVPSDKETVTPPSPSPFSDTKGNWAYSSIEELYVRGMIKGYPDGTFRPNSTMTRAEFTTLLINVLRLPAAKGTYYFKDITGHWAENAITQAQERDIIMGYSDQLFGPDEYLTREQMIAMIIRAFWPQQNTTNGDIFFADKVDISDWALSSIKFAIEKQFISGYPDGNIKPQAFATRAEVATLILAILKQL